VAGDAAAIKEVTQAYERLIETEKRQIQLRTAERFTATGRAASLYLTTPLILAGGAALKMAEENPAALLVVNLSGRGDKDVAQAQALLGAMA